MLRRCRYTTYQPESDVDDVTLRLSALWVIITTIPAAPVDDGVLADDQLLDWVTAAGARPAVRGRGRHQTGLPNRLPPCGWAGRPAQS